MLLLVQLIPEFLTLTTRRDQSNFSFVICVNLLHPLLCLFVYGLILSLQWFFILVNYYFSEPLGSFKLEVILYLAKIQNSIIKNTVSKYQSQLTLLNLVAINVVLVKLSKYNSQSRIRGDASVFTWTVTGDTVCSG